MISMTKQVSHLLGAVVLASAAVTASAVDTPPSLAGVTVIGAAQANRMINDGVAVYDVRVAAEYAEAHIKGAKSLPYKERSAKAVDFDKSKDSFDLRMLPADKNAPVIFYCNAGECWKSYKASSVAVSAGYQRVHWLRGGLPEWRAAKLPIE
ncbi:MAG: rhodanese-like domain-containing protein [Betaproteobacteria bacterium]|nr:rhodanese-like domain-containing protein [Betaproteobacteria bacterium]MDH5221790.1 rhodanese-like domain-containing protein [Betaproteobacteria bacterium]MDH5351483.1 rhodanese-like domain-containing protein [Betaproteobacteria bacterium]